MALKKFKLEPIPFPEHSDSPLGEYRTMHLVDQTTKQNLAKIVVYARVGCRETAERIEAAINSACPHS